MFNINEVKQDRDGDYILAEWVDGKPMYRKVRTDAEIFRAATEEWLDVLYSLWEAVGKELLEPLKDPRFFIYAKKLEKVPLGLLKKGVDCAINKNKYSSIPQLGEIWAGIQKELNALNLRPAVDIVEAIEIWKESRWRESKF